MNNRWMKLTAILLACGNAPFAFGYGFPSGFRVESLEQAHTAASTSRKPIMLYFAQPHCRYCDIVEGFLDSATLRAAYIPSYHFVLIDVTKNLRGDVFQKEMIARYKVRGTPAFVFLTADGKHVCTSYGGINHKGDGLALHRFVQARAANQTEDTSPGTRCGRLDSAPSITAIRQ
jgi:thioredoxin-related protein